MTWFRSPGRAGDLGVEADLVAHDGLELDRAEAAGLVAEGAVARDGHEVRLRHVDVRREVLAAAAGSARQRTHVHQDSTLVPPVLALLHNTK